MNIIYAKTSENDAKTMYFSTFDAFLQNKTKTVHGYVNQGKKTLHLVF